MDPTTGTWLSLGSYEEVFNSDWDYWAIHKALKQDNMILDKVLRIHNDFLKDRLEKELNLVKKGRSSDFDPNIQELYHGTGESLERICSEGLDERLSTSGHFGRGIYFSDRPGVCRIQSEINSPAKPFIVRCKIILGDCKAYPEGECDPSLTREPVKPTNTVGKNTFYDSVRGKTGDFNQFVIYDKRRAIVQYVIFYTTKDPLPSLPPIPRSESNPSTKKKKKKMRTSESHSTGSSRNSTSRSTAPSVGEDTQSESDHDSRSSGSVRSAVSSPSSDDSCSSDENSSHLGAVGGRQGPRTRPTGERSNNRVRSPREQPEQASVPKAKSTRQRTRRLLSEADTQSNAESSAAASSSSAGTPIGQDSSYVVDANKKKMQEAAMKHMLDLKGHVPPDKISELWEDFNRTYGGGTSGDTEENIPPSAFSANEDVDVEAVIDVLVEEFRQIVPGINPRIARQYIIQFDMDINKAMSAYFDSS